VINASVRKRSRRFQRDSSLQKSVARPLVVTFKAAKNHRKNIIINLDIRLNGMVKSASR
jgi:hypothetical protein